MHVSKCGMGLSIICITTTAILNWLPYEELQHNSAHKQTVKLSPCYLTNEEVNLLYRLYVAPGKEVLISCELCYYLYQVFHHIIMSHSTE